MTTDRAPEAIPLAHPPFGLWRVPRACCYGAPHGCRRAMQLGRDLPISPRLICGVVVLSTLILVFAVTPRCLTLPRTLREQTKVPAHRLVDDVARAPALIAVPIKALSPPQAVPALTFRVSRHPLPRLLLVDPLPAGRAHGADALGVNIPRARRWLVLGGHGRHGAGLAA